MKIYRPFLLLSLMILSFTFSIEQRAIAQNTKEPFIVFVGMDGNLYMAHLNGESATVLAPQSGTDNLNLQVTPDGNHVLYSTSDAVYSVSTDSGERVSLADLQYADSFWNPRTNTRTPYFLSPKGTYILVSSGLRNDPKGLGLYVFLIPVAGGDPIPLMPKLGGDLTPQGSYAFTPDDQTLVFLATNGRGVPGLYAIPTTGGATTQLTGRIVSGGSIAGFQPTPDGKYVIYLADSIEQGSRSLFRVLITGGDSVQLNPEGSKFNDYDSYWGLSPDGSYALFIAADGPLYSIHIEDGQVVNLDTPVIYVFGYTPDNRYVLYGNQRLNRIPLEGGTRTQLIDSVPRQVAVSADSTYVAAIDANSQLKLISIEDVDVRSGFSQADTVVRGGLISSSPENRFVFWAGSRVYGMPADLYSVPLAGGGPIKLNDAPGSGQLYTTAFAITSDGKQVIYQLDEEAATYPDLYVVPIEGGTPVRLTSDDSGGAADFVLYPPAPSSVINYTQGY